VGRNLRIPSVLAQRVKEEFFPHLWRCHIEKLFNVPVDFKMLVNCGLQANFKLPLGIFDVVALCSRESFLLKAFVNRVNLRLIIRIVRFWRSMYDVLTNCGSGFPVTTLDIDSLLEGCHRF
jgi:hypothetical protein